MIHQRDAEVVLEQSHGSESRGRLRQVKLHPDLTCNGHQWSYSGCDTFRRLLKPDELLSAQCEKTHSAAQSHSKWKTKLMAAAGNPQNTANL